MGGRPACPCHHPETGKCSLVSSVATVHLIGTNQEEAAVWDAPVSEVVVLVVRVLLVAIWEPAIWEAAFWEAAVVAQAQDAK